MSTPRVFALVGGGCLLLVVLGGLGTCLGLRWLATEPDGVRVEVTAPLHVTLGESFRVVAVARNTSERPRTLVDLDIARSYLDGVAVESSRPPFRDAMHVPIDETLSHSFDLSIAPGAEARIELTMRAVRAGDFTGDVDFCIDSEVRCLSYPVRTLVAAPSDRAR